MPNVPDVSSFPEDPTPPTSTETGRACRARSVPAALLVTLVTAAAGGCGFGSEDATPSAAGEPEEGISRALASLRQSTIGDLAYHFRISVPESLSQPVTGWVTVRFQRSDPEGRPLTIDFLSPRERVRSVTLEGREVEVRFEHDHVVVPGELLPREGPVELGIAFRAGDEALNRSDDYLYSLFVPDRAHFSLPVFDQPDLKARFRLHLEVPSAWRATSNGAVLEELGSPPASEGSGSETGPVRPSEGSGSETDPVRPSEGAGSEIGPVRPSEGSGRETDPVRPSEGSGGEDGSSRWIYRFAETEPLPTYLFAFVAGRFQVEEAERADRRITFHHRETDSARVALNLETLFDLHGTALEWLEDYTGIEYPFQHFGFVGIPGFQYNGMEHPGAVYYRASSLFLDESTTQSELLGRASVIAHETAHMWFGDLVTMEWFDDVWMKEVFANFMAAKIVNPSFPELDHELRFFLSHYPAAYAVDRSGGTHPIRQDLENLNEAGSLYGPIIYQKAPIAMRQLELLVGEEAFRDGLREYLDRYRFGNASWPDLIEVLDRRLPEDLAAWSRMWVEEPGRPAVAASLVGDERIRSLRVEQEDPAGRGRTWPQAFHVVLGYGPDSTVALPVRLLGESAEVEGAEGMAVPRWVLPGGMGVGYGHFRVDPQSRERLLRDLPRVGDPLVRGVGWATLWEEVLEGAVSPDIFVTALLDGIGGEEVELNLQRLLGYLGTTWWRLLDDAARADRATEVERVLWEGVVGDGPRTVRSSFFRTYRSVAITPEGAGRLRDIWEGERELPDLPLSEEDRTALAVELAIREVDDLERILDDQLESIRNPDRRDRFAFIRPSLSTDPAVRETFFRSLSSPENREREPWVADAVANLHHPLRAPHGEQLILPSLELLEEIRRTGDIFFPTAWLDATLWGHRSPEAAATVRDFLEERPAYPDRLRQKILQSADMLFRAAAIQNGDG